jgi:hypothetical protein
LGVCGFNVGNIGYELAGWLKLLPAVPEHIRRNPNNPERDSDN